MRELLFRAHLLGFVSLLDRSRVVAQPVIRHAERKLRVEVFRVLLEQSLELGYRADKIALAKVEHRIVISFLRRHIVDKRP